MWPRSRLSDVEEGHDSRLGRSDDSRESPNYASTPRSRPTASLSGTGLAMSAEIDGWEGTEGPIDGGVVQLSNYQTGKYMTGEPVMYEENDLVYTPNGLAFLAGTPRERHGTWHYTCCYNDTEYSQEQLKKPRFAVGDLVEWMRMGSSSFEKLWVVKAHVLWAESFIYTINRVDEELRTEMPGEVKSNILEDSLQGFSAS